MGGARPAAGPGEADTAGPIGGTTPEAPRAGRYGAASAERDCGSAGEGGRQRVRCLLSSVNCDESHQSTPASCSCGGAICRGRIGAPCLLGRARHCSARLFPSPAAEPPPRAPVSSSHVGSPARRLVDSSPPPVCGAGGPKSSISSRLASLLRQIRRELRDRSPTTAGRVRGDRTSRAVSLRGMR